MGLYLCMDLIKLALPVLPSAQMAPYDVTYPAHLCYYRFVLRRNIQSLDRSMIPRFSGSVMELSAYCL